MWVPCPAATTMSPNIRLRSSMPQRLFEITPRMAPSPHLPADPWQRLRVLGLLPLIAAKNHGRRHISPIPHRLHHPRHLITAIARHLLPQHRTVTLHTLLLPRQRTEVPFSIPYTLMRQNQKEGETHRPHRFWGLVCLGEITCGTRLSLLRPQ